VRVSCLRNLSIGFRGAFSGPLSLPRKIAFPGGGDHVIYSFGCIVAGVTLALGVFDYWFGQGGLIVFLSWAVLAAILWAIASAIRYILSGRL
jgi:hypothetical protein